jgi:small subunit ribosomal protein S16
MPAKIRLQRFGKKGQPYYHIVIADGRAPRDGRFIEKIGTYNPLTRPADIQLDFDRALYWVKSGAQPTETVEAILKYTGVAYMHHLSKGVAKSAMTEEQAKEKFEAWKTAKSSKIESSRKDIQLKGKNEDKKRMEAEAKANEAKAAAVAKKRAGEAAAEAKAEAKAEAEVAAPEEVVVEVVAAEEVVAEVAAAEEVVAEVVETEVPAAAEVVAEVVETEVPAAAEVVAEVATEEAPEAPAAESTEEKA